MTNQSSISADHVIKPNVVAPIYNPSTSMVARWVVETGELLEGYLAKGTGIGSSTREIPRINKVEGENQLLKFVL